MKTVLRSTGYKCVKYAFLSLFLLMASSSLFAQNTRYYWVGGSTEGDNWTTFENWSTTSGGQGGTADGISQAPTNGITVVFDKNSKKGATVPDTIFISGAVACDSLIVMSNGDGVYEAPVFVFSNTDDRINIKGSLLLHKAVNFLFTDNSFNGWDYKHQFLQFTSDDPVNVQTVKTSGTVMGKKIYYYGRSYSDRMDDARSHTVFQAQGTMLFAGSGKWKLDGTLTVPMLQVTNGTLDFNGNNLTAMAVEVTGGKMIFPNRTITCTQTWTYTGGAALTAAETGNSKIRIHGGIFSGRGTDKYNDVEFYGNSNIHYIDKGQFNKITFLAGRSYGIGTNQGTTPVDSLITDRLIIETSGEFRFNKMTVKNEFKAVPPGNGGQVWLRGCKARVGSRDSINITNSSASFVVERAVINDLAVTSGTSRNAVKSYDWGNNGTGWTFTGTPDAGRDMRWIGGNGMWNDPANWQPSSGPAGIPTLADNVIFDTGSTGIGNKFTNWYTDPEGVRLNGVAWCKNMKWEGASDTPLFSFYGGNVEVEGGYQFPGTVVIGGSLTYQGDMKFATTWYNCWYYFVSNSSTVNTITNNGAPTHCVSMFFHSPSGNGKWKVTDKVDYLRNMRLYAGSLDLSGAEVLFGNGGFQIEQDNTIEGFSGESPNRELNIANAVIGAENNSLHAWRHLGGQPLTSAQSKNSLIVAYTSFLTKTGDIYYDVKMKQYIATDSEVRPIVTMPGSDYTSFNKITLTGINTYLNHKNGSIRPDSLLLVGNGIYTVERDFTINRHLATSEACGGQTTFKALTEPITITMGTGIASKADRVKVQNTIITDINITNGDYNVYDCSLKGEHNGWLNNTAVAAKNLYWIGGINEGKIETEGKSTAELEEEREDTRRWENPENWSLSSGGISLGAGGCIPRAIDNVIFDNASFIKKNQSVSVRIPSYCNNMNWIGTDEEMKPRLNIHDGGLFINGSLEFQKGMTAGINGYFYMNFISDRPNETIRTNGVVGVPQMRFNGTGGWTLQDSLIMGGNLLFEKGNLNFNGQKVVIDKGFLGHLPAINRDSRSLKIQNADITVKYDYWNYTGNLQANGSKIAILNTNNLEDSNRYFAAESTEDYTAQYHNLTLHRNTTVKNGIYNKIQALASATFENIVTDTLHLANNENHEYVFVSDSKITVKEELNASGTACIDLTLRSSKETVPAIFDIKRAAANDKANNTLVFNFAYIHGIKALTESDNAKLHKGSLCPDGPGLLGWIYGTSAGHYNSDWWKMDNFASTGAGPFEDVRLVGCDAFSGLGYRLSSAPFAPPANADLQWFTVGPEDERTNILEKDGGKERFLYIKAEGKYGLTVHYARDEFDPTILLCPSTDIIEIKGGAVDSLVWTGNFDKDWNNPANWYHPKSNAVSVFAPNECISVLIPAGRDRYPDLTSVADGGSTIYGGLDETAACNDIWFEHGGEVVRTDSLHYSAAHVELTLAANRWNMISAPLRYMYTGDYYKNDPCPHADHLRIYQQLFET
ncbi:MAG: hypothetical protein LBI82_07990, partial [Dysgonamonadaceae bacterium]|nr:hypothetical protein [Dysgonamonadaceae bacterium]